MSVMTAPIPRVVPIAVIIVGIAPPIITIIAVIGVAPSEMQ
jgi:hypothetical protein